MAGKLSVPSVMETEQQLRHKLFYGVDESNHQIQYEVRIDNLQRMHDWSNNLFDFLMVYTREQHSSDPSLKTKLKDFIDDFRANWSNQNRSTTTRLSSSLEHSIFKLISLLLIHYYDKQVSNDLLGLIN